MEANKLNDILKKLSVECQTISFEDNKKGVKYTITKDNNSNKYILETSVIKEIDSNDNLDNLFNDMNEYFDSINEQDYWPSESEYPDLHVLWRVHKSDNEELNKSGSIKYPNDWDLILEKFKKNIEKNWY